MTNCCLLARLHASIVSSPPLQASGPGLYSSILLGIGRSCTLLLLPLLPIVMADGEASKAVSLLFRIAALVLSVTAAAVMGTASQLVVVDGDRGAPSSYAVSYSQYNALK